MSKPITALKGVQDEPGVMSHVEVELRPGAPLYWMEHAQQQDPRDGGGLVENYNPNQPRDAEGKWIKVGALASHPMWGDFEIKAIHESGATVQMLKDSFLGPKESLQFLPNPSLAKLTPLKTQPGDLAKKLGHQDVDLGQTPLPHPDAVTVLHSLGGSTGAVLVQDASGQKWAMKKGEGYMPAGGTTKADHIRNEVDADNAYRALGVPVPHSGIVEHNGVPHKFSKWVEGTDLGAWEKGRSQVEIDAMHKKIGEHFAADALLGNWDSIGLAKDNIKVGTDGVPYRIDNGGALKYRAQGKAKTFSQFGKDVGELKTLKDPYKNPNAAEVFKHVGESQTKAQVEALQSKKAELLKAIKDPDARALVDARLASLGNQTGAHAPPAAPAAPAAPAPSPQKTPKAPDPFKKSEAHGSHAVGGGGHATGEGLKDLIKGGGTFTSLQLDKIAHMNPGGVGTGVVKVPKATSPASIEHMMKVLPAGTVIKKVEASSKKIGLQLGDEVGKAFKEADSKKTKKVQDYTDSLDAKPTQAGGYLAKAQAEGKTSMEKALAKALDDLKYDPAKPAGPQFVGEVAHKIAQDMGTHLTVEDAAEMMKGAGLALKSTVPIADPSFVPLNKQYKVKTSKAAAEAIKDHAKTVATTKWTSDEYDAVKSYTGSFAYTVNPAMRSCPPDFKCIKDPGTKKKMNHIMSALDKAGPLPEPVYVKRGITLTQSTIDKILAEAGELQKTGGHFNMPCFTSTSVEGGFGGNFQFQIIARTGVYVGPGSGKGSGAISSHAHEHEVLQSPKANYKVVGFKPNHAGKAILQLEEVI